MIEITNQYMSLKVDGKVVATARFSQYAAADGNGAWIVSTHSARLFTRDQAITALTVAELGESWYPDSHPLLVAPQGVAVTGRLIRLTTALAVVAVASVAAIISNQHAYELVGSRGESGTTADLLPFTVDGLVWAASMVVLDASRRNQRVPPLAA
jgi:hypothetical protein